MDGLKVTTDPGITELEWTQNDSIVTGFLHVFEVTANNGRGESDKSQSLSIYAATIPDVPLDLMKVASSGSFVTFSWSPPALDGGSPITDYEVYWDSGARDNAF